MQVIPRNRVKFSNQMCNTTSMLDDQRAEFISDRYCSPIDPHFYIGKYFENLIKSVGHVHIRPPLLEFDNRAPLASEDMYSMLTIMEIPQ